MKMINAYIHGIYTVIYFYLKIHVLNGNWNEDDGIPRPLWGSFPGGKAVGA
jgi:hypothetical protein